MGINLNRFKGSGRSKEWLDWLEDDPVPTSMRMRMRERAVRAASRPIVRRVGERPHAGSPVGTHSKQPVRQNAAHIQIPDFSKIKSSLGLRQARKLKSTRTRYFMAASGLIIVVAGALVAFKWPFTSEKPTTDTVSVLSQQSTAKPEFDYSLPKGDDTAIDGSVRYDPEKKVVNFQDSIGGIVITVSQQPLPAGLTEDTQNKVKKLAEDFSATKVLAEANPTAYLGTSVKGPQTVIFAKNGTLVFIHSTKEIDENDWAEYITNLQ